MNFKQFRNYVWGMYGNNTISRGWELYKKSQHALWMARAKNADLMSCKESYNEYIREHPYSRWNDVRSAYSYATSFTNWSRWFQHISRTCLAKAKEFEYVTRK